MRIIAGELKGRRLMTPQDNRVRPTTDKVKEAVFSMVQSYLPDGVVIDCFAGTGSLGLEAVSRGARHVYFIDKDKASIRLVKENVAYCGVGDRATILWADYERALGKVDQQADVIFLDPPYDAGIIEDVIGCIIEKDRLAEDGIIVCEHSFYDSMPEEISGLTVLKSKKYGKIGITVYHRPIEED